MMIFYYIKTALKNLCNNKKYTLINILGFSFSLSIALIIILFVLHETSYNRYHSNYKQIYRFIDDEHKSSGIDYRVKDILLDRFAEVSNACLYLQISHDISISYKDEGYYVNHISSVDNDFLSNKVYLQLEVNDFWLTPLFKSS